MSPFSIFVFQKSVDNLGQSRRAKKRWKLTYCNKDSKNAPFLNVRFAQISFRWCQGSAGGFSRTVNTATRVSQKQRIFN